MSAPTRPVVVRGGTMVEAHWSGPSDLLLRDGRVEAVLAPGAPLAADVEAEDPEVIDASGLLVMPGGVDPHCHVGFTSGEFTSLDSYEQATRAAVHGGTTTIVDFAIPVAGETPLSAVERQRPKAETGWCDSALHGCVVTWTDETAEELGILAEQGIVTVKMYTTYRGESMADYDTILAVMNRLGELGGMVVVHCESNHLIEHAQACGAAIDHIGAEDMAATRPELAETSAVVELLAIAEQLDVPIYFVHQSTPAAVDLVADARKRGVRAFTESVVHHLVLDESAYAGTDPELFVCCPPLRPADAVAGLQQRLVEGLVHSVGSDHCCYDTAQKRKARDDVRAMPNGLPGVETRMPVLFSQMCVDKGLPATRFVDVTSRHPAQVNGLYPRKGTLAPGADADVVLWDPAATRVVDAGDLHMATDYSPYDGLAITGWPRTVLVRGRVVVRDGVHVEGTPWGRHLPAAPLPADLR